MGQFKRSNSAADIAALLGTCDALARRSRELRQQSDVLRVHSHELRQISQALQADLKRLRADSERLSAYARRIQLRLSPPRSPGAG
jgi:hypothetical protein